MAGASPQGEDGKSAAPPQTSQDKSVSPAHPHPAAAGEGGHVKAGKWGLIIGAIGVVYGGTAELAVLGVVSLVFWALILVVTLKYVVFLMKADNKGEGGTLALMALAQRAMGRRSGLVFLLGVCGAALFYGDGVITPAISVVSADECLRDAPGMGDALVPCVVPSGAVRKRGRNDGRFQAQASAARSRRGRPRGDPRRRSARCLGAA